MKSRGLHPIVAAWGGDWARGMRITQSAPQYANARKTSQVVERRHQLVSDVFIEAERLGGKALENDDYSLAVRAHGVSVEFSIVERLRMVRLPLDNFDARFQTNAAKRGYRSGFGPTGRLVFKIETYVSRLGKSIWEEGKDGDDLSLVVGTLAQALITASQLKANEAAGRAEAERRAAIEIERRQLVREAKEKDERRWEDFCQATSSLRTVRGRFYADRRNREGARRRCCG
jgi:hypothetical protein